MEGGWRDGDGGSAGEFGRARGVSRGTQPGDHPPAHYCIHTDATDTPTAPAADGKAAMDPSTSVQAAPSQAASVPRVTTVGQTEVKMHQSALSKVGLIHNQLLTACGCAACAC